MKSATAVDDAFTFRALGRGDLPSMSCSPTPEVTSVQTDPSPDNKRAIRGYRAAGSAEVGVVDTPDGTALLMRIGRPRGR